MNSNISNASWLNQINTILQAIPSIIDIKASWSTSRRGHQWDLARLLAPWPTPPLQRGGSAWGPSEKQSTAGFMLPSDFQSQSALSSRGNPLSSYFLFLKLRSGSCCCLSHRSCRRRPVWESRSLSPVLASILSHMSSNEPRSLSYSLRLPTVPSGSQKTSYMSEVIRVLG